MWLPYFALRSPSPLVEATTTDFFTASFSAQPSSTLVSLGVSLVLSFFESLQGVRFKQRHIQRCGANERKDKSFLHAMRQE